MEIRISDTGRGALLDADRTGTRASEISIGQSIPTALSEVNNRLGGAEFLFAPVFHFHSSPLRERSKFVSSNVHILQGAM